MFETLIIAVIRRVVGLCKTEAEFAAFGYAVMGADGWGWIFRNAGLAGQVDVPIPPATAGVFTDAQLATILGDIRARGWTMDSLMHDGESLGTTTVPTPGPVRAARAGYLRAMATGLASETVTYWKCTEHPFGHRTLTALNEDNVTLSLLDNLDSGTVWELFGAVSDGWGGRAAVCRAFLTELARTPGARPASCLAVMSRKTAGDLFHPILAQSGNSCLVGIMICDIVLSNGKRLRAISLSANMATLTNGTRVGQTSSGQGASQMHMEIFHFERLQVVLTELTGPPPGTIKSVDIAVLGYKNGNVVKESGMCVACANTLQESVMFRTGVSVKEMKQEVYLV